MAAKREKRLKQLQREAKAQPSYAGRRHAVLAVFIVAAGALIWRAVDRQILEKDFLQSAGTDQYLTQVDMLAHRGLITDRRGDVLALSTPVDSVAANPRVLRADAAGLPVLAKMLDVDIDDLRQKLARYSNRHFVYLKRRLPPSQVDQILDRVSAEGIQGVHREREYKRYYPTGEIFAHVIGFTNHLDVGQEGLEREYDEVLRGVAGAKRVLRDGRRRVVEDVESVRTPRDGSHLALSLDRRLQFLAYRELKAAIRRHRAVSGSLVLMDSRSGEVLAMVNQPGFNPNRSRSSQGGRLRNRAVTDVFEPGSTMKPFTVAAGLQLGVVRSDAVIDTAPGFFKVGRISVRDHHNLGQVDLQTVLRKSSNVGVSKIAMQLDSDDYWQVLNDLGFGHAAQVGFPGEAAGLLRDHHRWVPIDQATLAFGYGLSTSTLQLAQAYTALANDGHVVPATLLKRAEAVKGRRVFSPGVAREVRHMLESVVSIDGTAPQAAVEGYRVAGKTGTVKKLEAGGYADDRYAALFAGLAPASDPRLVLVVMIDEPRGKKYYGGQVAAPVFSRVMGEALRLLNVRPDALPTQRVRLAQLGELQ